MNIVLIGVLVSISFAIISFIATSNFIVTGIVFAITILYFIIFANPFINKYNIKITRYHECYYFINNFIVILSIKGSIKNAFDSAGGYGSKSLDDVIKGIDDLPEEDKLRYLQRYFKFHIYVLFIDLVNIFIEEGGDIIKISQHLINQLRSTEEYIIEAIQMAKRKIFEFISLWAFSLMILAFLRFALSQFYSYLITQLFYLIGVVLIFVFAVVSIHIMLIKINKIEMRGWVDE